MAQLKRLLPVWLLVAAVGLLSCNGNRANHLLLHKKWRVYDVQIPAGDPYDITQVSQAVDLKKGYYSDVYYQFLDDNLFIATIAGVPDSGKYSLLSNGSIISVTASNGLRSAEHLVSIVHLDEQLFDMKVKSGDYNFVLRTKASQ
ncbi:hypothetical protein F0L74_13285 [Chitinophaga agrisoli]|uniref:Lipocalin-like protein n=1 Tax=Chitinophaga agrisoli TaxID=2607653 RepID=A0A5B2VUL8_9BACT|nr:hypothetical protein [Chitinophaga agrisoli]KAA2243463.1 hypothetical protein F0L74_13285 [Chitinophaga agrisoli]